MGNKNNAGFLKLNQTVYSPGDNVFGEFCLKVVQDLYAEKVVIKVRGVEEVEWEDLQQGGIKMNKGGQTLIHYDLELYRFHRNSLAKGDYVFQFVIELPKDIPSSTSFNLPRLKGKIEYTIEAQVIGTDISSLSYLKIVDMTTITPSMSEIYTKLKGILWIERGEVYMRAKCPQGYSYNDEKLQLIIDIDRTNSHWGVGAIDVSVTQTISVKSSDNKRYIRKSPVYSRHLPVQRTEFGLEILLSNLSQGVSETSSSLSKYIEVGYSLEISGVMESIFACYGENPQLSLWFSIVAKNKETEMPKYNFQWKPKYIEISSRNSVPIYS